MDRDNKKFAGYAIGVLTLGLRFWGVCCSRMSIKGLLVYTLTHHKFRPQSPKNPKVASSRKESERYGLRVPCFPLAM